VRERERERKRGERCSGSLMLFIVTPHLVFSSCSFLNFKVFLLLLMLFHCFCGNSSFVNGFYFLRLRLVGSFFNDYFVTSNRTL